MMRTSYDPEAEALHARFAPDGVAIEGTEERAASVMVDFDDDGNVVGIEVLNVSRRGRKAATATCSAEAAAE